MQFLKVSCSQCTHYQSCPQKTRMYVNYCGSDLERFRPQVDEAKLDCRDRRGQLFAQTILSVLPVAPGMQPLPNFGS